MGKRIGICLTGGGARGAYQIGALKALEERGILDNVVAYSGTSIGAANAAVVATKGIDEAKEVWMTMPEQNLPKINKGYNNTKNKHFDFNKGIYSMEVFEDTIRKSVDLEAIKDHEVYVTLSEGGKSDDGLIALLKSSYRHYIKKETKVVYLPLHKTEKDDAIKAIIASSSIPIAFAPVTMEDRKFYDGGVFDNIPVKPLANAGCDEIIIIHLHKNLLFKPENIAKDIVYHEIKHKGPMGHILKFSEKQTKRLYQAGYDDTNTYFDTLD